MLIRLIGFFLLLTVSLTAYDEDLTLIEAEATASGADDVHGFFNLAFKNDYITPRGLLVTNTDLTIQVLAGLVLDVYKDPCSLISNVSITFGCWNDLWTGQDDPYVGVWNEFDWFFGFSASIAKNWKVGVQYIQFISPPRNFYPENNIEFLIGYDDSSWGNPIVINPYVKLFWAVSGKSSTVVVGRHGDTYDVEIGMIPTYERKNGCFPFTISAPTWITVGPASFWNGSDLALKNEHSHFGVFSTGLLFRTPLTFIPKRLGDWYFDIGGQYYYLINDNLLQAQTFTLGLDSYKDGHRNVGVASASIGFGF